MGVDARSKVRLRSGRIRQALWPCLCVVLLVSAAALTEHERPAGTISDDLARMGRGPARAYRRVGSRDRGSGSYHGRIPAWTSRVSPVAVAAGRVVTWRLAPFNPPEAGNNSGRRVGPMKTISLTASLLAAVALGCADMDITEAENEPRLGYTSAGEPVPVVWTTMYGAEAPDGTRKLFSIDEAPDWALEQWDLKEAEAASGAVAGDVAPGPLCGNEGELTMEMQTPYTIAEISQDTLSGTVTFSIEAFQETHLFHPPGTGRQEARHEVDVTGSLTGFGPDRPVPLRWPSPACQSWARVFAKSFPLPVYTKGVMCVAGLTSHYATNDFVLQSWSDATYDKVCIRVCPAGQRNCWNGVY